jgi:putative DNA primase/helicase
MREFVFSETERLGCPPEFVFGPLLVSAGAAIGTQLGVRPKLRDDWYEFPILWGFTCGNPGSMKTPAASAALTFINAIGESSKADSGVRRNASSEKSSRTPRFVTNDATPQALTRLCAKSGRAILLHMDELPRFFHRLDAKGHETDRAWFLESWSGKSPYKTDRVYDGHHEVARLAVSISGTLQPDVLGNILRGQAQEFASAGDGLLARFQIAYVPDHASTGRMRDISPNDQARQRLAKVFSSIGCVANHCAATVERLSDGFTPVLRSTPEAFSWLSDCADKTIIPYSRDAASPQLAAHFDKYVGALAKIALIVEVVTCLDSSQPLEHVSESSMFQAWRIVSHLISHAERIYGTLPAQEVQAAEKLLRAVCEGAITASTTLRQIYRLERGGLRTPADVWKGLELLQDLNFLRVEPSPRNRQVIVLRPDALTSAHEMLEIQARRLGGTVGTPIGMPLMSKSRRWSR